MLNFWAFLILYILVWREAWKCSVRKTTFFLNSAAYQTRLSLLTTSQNEIARKKRKGILFNIWKWSTNTFHLIQTQCAQFRLLFTLHYNMLPSWKTTTSENCSLEKSIISNNLEKICVPFFSKISLTCFCVSWSKSWLSR